MVTGYCGFDPSARRASTSAISFPSWGSCTSSGTATGRSFLAGGGTGMIGDPSGKTDGATAAVAGRDRGEHGDRSAASSSVSSTTSGKNAAIIDNNAKWLAPLGAIEFMRDVGKHFTVNYMMQKESVKARLESGVSYTEFSYMLLQAYDYLQLHKLYGVTLQVGGSDQWGNITAGIELIRRTTGAESHALTFPLLTTASGTKFGKTEAGAVWLDPKRTSPYSFYQFWVNTDDRDVGQMSALLHAAFPCRDRSARPCDDGNTGGARGATDTGPRRHAARARR